MRMKMKLYGNKRKEDFKMKKILSTAGWLVMAAALTLGQASCSSDNDIIDELQPVKKNYTLTIRANKGGGEAVTRALELSSDGKSINALWTPDERVFIFKTNGDNFVNVGEMEPTDISDDGTSCTLVATITASALAEAGGIHEDDALTLVYYGSANGMGPVLDQDGTLATIQSYYDNCEASVKVKTIDSDNNITVVGLDETTTIDFENKQAIAKFTLRQLNGSPLPNNPSNVTITYKLGGSVSQTITLSNIPSTVYSTNGDGVLYAQFPPFESTVSIDADDDYTYTTPNQVSFAEGLFYPITVKMIKKGTIQEAFMNGKKIRLEFTALYNSSFSSDPILLGGLSVSSTFNEGRFGETTTNASGLISNLLKSVSVARSGENLLITVTTVEQMPTGFPYSIMPTNISGKTGTMTINTVDNDYTWSNTTIGKMITLNSITIDGTSITPLPIP